MIVKEIPLEKIEVGMELAADVVNKYKQVLIHSNMRFEEKHRFLLKTWGIKTVKIKVVVESEMPYSISAEKRAEAALELKKRMNWIPRNEIESELVEIAIRRICQKSSIRNE